MTPYNFQRLTKICSGVWWGACKQKLGRSSRIQHINNTELIRNCDFLWERWTLLSRMYRRRLLYHKDWITLFSTLKKRLRDEHSHKCLNKALLVVQMFRTVMPYKQRHGHFGMTRDASNKINRSHWKVTSSRCKNVPTEQIIVARTVFLSKSLLKI